MYSFIYNVDTNLYFLFYFILLDSLATQKYDDDDGDPVDAKYGDLDPFVMMSRNGLTNTSKLLHTMPLDKQVLQVIQGAGDQGITNKVR